MRFKQKNEIIETGEILCKLELSGQENSLYYFDKEGSEGHYDKNGKVLKGIDENPINGARSYPLDEKASNRWL